MYVFINLEPLHNNNRFSSGSIGGSMILKGMDPNLNCTPLRISPEAIAKIYLVLQEYESHPRLENFS